MSNVGAGAAGGAIIGGVLGGPLGAGVGAAAGAGIVKLFGHDGTPCRAHFIVDEDEIARRRATLAESPHEARSGLGDL